jgi:hypothetical protein
MSLDKVWIRTVADGLLRADQIIGLDARTSPIVNGRNPHWLLDASLAVPSGGGGEDSWNLTLMRRTLLQTDAEPLAAEETLARLLASLSEVDASGIITPMTSPAPEADPGASGVRFTFSPFLGTPAPATSDTSNRQAPAREPSADGDRVRPAPS